MSKPKQQKSPQIWSHPVAPWPSRDIKGLYYAAFLLDQIQSCTPDAFGELLTDVLPIYTALCRQGIWANIEDFFADAIKKEPLDCFEGIEFSGSRPLMNIRSVFAREWAANGVCPTDGHYGLTELREAILAWLNKYELRSWFVLFQILSSLHVLSDRHPPILNYRADLLMYPKLSHLPIYIPPFDGTDRRRYRRETLVGLKSVLDGYLDSWTTDIGRLDVKPMTKPLRFRMLALYKCAFMTPERIAEKLELHKDPKKVLIDIKEAAGILSLGCRQRGRPANKKVPKRST